MFVLASCGLHVSLVLKVKHTILYPPIYACLIEFEKDAFTYRIQT